MRKLYKCIDYNIMDSSTCTEEQGLDFGLRRIILEGEKCKLIVGRYNSGGKGLLTDRTVINCRIQSTVCGRNDGT